MISIVIPTYNHREGLEQCLTSIIRQTHSEWEVIIVDDGSTDSTGDWIVSFLTAHPEESRRIRYITQKNAGAPAARNRGAQDATGEYIIFVDADVVLAPTMLEKMLHALREHPEASYVYSDFQFGWKLFRARSFDAEALRSNNYIHTSSLVRRADCPAFDEQLKRFQDWDLWLTMLDQGKQGTYLNEMLFRIRVLRKGMSIWRPRLWYALCRRFPSLAPESYWSYVSAKQTVRDKHDETSFVRKTSPWLSVIIVAWNAKRELRACLDALGESSEVEIIVVDNASNDGTVTMLQHSYPGVMCVANEVNAGFGRACNQGAARARGDYLVFLNPDTVTQVNELQTLKTFLEAQPNIGIVGPQLRYANDSIQPSCRRFPDVFSTVLLLLKIHLIVPGLWPFRKHFMTAFRHETLRQVDQVMGACMMMRRKLFEELQGFDTRYYLWYEDVDLCRRSYDLGYLTMFVPTAVVHHQLSSAFRRRSLAWKQWHLARSARLYFRQHASFIAWLLVSAAAWISLLPAIVTSPFTRLFRQLPPTIPQGERNQPSIIAPWVLLLFFADALSFVTHFYPPSNGAFFWLALIGFIGLVWYEYQAAVLVALLEIFVGSHGYLFSFTFAGFPVSLRMAFFVVLFVVGLWKLLRQRSRVITLSKVFWPLGLLAAVVIAAALRGVFAGNDLAAVFFDVNAYAFFALIIPLVVAMGRDRAFVDKALTLILVAAMYLSLKTILLLYLFTHDFGGVLPHVYEWLRDTKIAELTPTATGAYRIFIASQLYVIAAWFLVLSDTHLTPRQRLLMLSTFAATLLISFSRSYWLGWVLATVGWFGLLVVRRRAMLIRSATLVGTSLLMAFIGIIFILNIPVPKPSSNGSLELQKRLEFHTEEAASSRWNLLGPLWERSKQHLISGSGFGTAVTYISNDPRVRADHPDGRYTTTAFEWGYLEMILKYGILGLGIYFLLILKNFWSLRHEKGIYQGLLFAVLAVLLVHVGSPYLNHPLGITIMLLLSVAAYTTAEAPTS